MMTEFWVSLVTVGIFAIGLYISRIERVARSVSQSAYQGVAAMTNASLSDDEKELYVRRSGMALFFGAWSIFWRFAVCLTAAYLPIYLADAINLAKESDVIRLMLRLDYILIVSLVLIGVVWFVSHGRESDKSLDNKRNYNLGERLLHMVAFGSPTLMKVAAKIDDAIFRLFNRANKNHPPIFITSLARGGTTALLNAFSDMPFIATHTYRDMPFITAPYLWNRMSAPFRRKVVSKERAHGDGLKIDLDSPEAFDEVLWMLYWPEKYKEQTISLWQDGDLKTTATSRFQNCFSKITHIRGQSDAYYLSKNNANIARLRVIPSTFPGAHVIIALRRPAQHAASLLRQHKNFLEQQSNDDFIKRYMRDIGHLEFGLLHSPIAFNDFDYTAYKPDSPDYWLAYWIAAFKEVRSNLDRVHIVLQDDLRMDANSCMRRLLEKLDFDADNQDYTRYFRNVPDETDMSVFSPALLAAAESLYDELSGKAV